MFYKLVRSLGSCISQGHEFFQLLFQRGILRPKSLTLAAEQPIHFKPASKVREMSKRVVALCTLALPANLNLGGLLVKPQCERELACRLNKCLI